jgi:hypothetical protein
MQTAGITVIKNIRLTGVLVGNMAYNIEKYKDKRNKVLGIKKRGVSFGTLATIVALCIVFGAGALVVPKAVTYFSTRNLDDAIYKMADSRAWDPNLVTALAEMEGVENVVTDNNNTRLVVTFNRLDADTHKIDALFERHDAKADLLNKMNHRQRMSILEKEAEFEAL